MLQGAVNAVQPLYLLRYSQWSFLLTFNPFRQWEATSFWKMFSVKWETCINYLHFHSCSTLTQTNIGNNLASTPQDMQGPIQKSPSLLLCKALLSLDLLPSICVLHQCHLFHICWKKEGLRRPNHKEKGVIYTILHIAPEFYWKNKI